MNDVSQVNGDRDNELFRAQVELLYRNSNFGMRAASVGALVLIALLWQMASQILLLSWAAGAAAIMLTRLYLLSARRRYLRDASRIRTAYGVVLACNFLGGAIWGVAFPLFSEGRSLELQLVLVTGALVIMTGAGAAYAVRQDAVYATAAPIITGLFVGLWAGGTTQHFQILLFVVFFLVMLHVLVRRIGDMTTEVLRKGIDNTGLIRYLTDARAAAEGVAMQLENERVQRLRTEQTIAAIARVESGSDAMLDSRALLTGLAVEAMRLVNAQAVCAGIFETGEIVCRESDASGKVYERGNSIAVETGVAHEIKTRATPFVTNDLRAEVNARGVFSTSSSRRMLCVPVRDHGGATIGFVEARDPLDGADFDPADAERLEFVARSAALMLHYSTASRRLRRLDTAVAVEWEVLRAVLLQGELMQVLTKIEHTVESHMPGLHCRIHLRDREQSGAAHRVAQPDGTASRAGGNWTLPVLDASLHEVATLELRAATDAPLTSVEIDLATKIAEYVALTIDRVRAQSRLLLQSRAMESSQNAIVIVKGVNREARVIYSNPAFERITGYRADELAERPWTDLLCNDLAIEQAPELTGKPGELVSGTRLINGRRRNGEEFFAECAVARVMGPNGEVRDPVEHLVVLNDVTERVLAERAVHASERKLKAVSDNMPGVAFQLVRGRDGSLRFDYASDGVQRLLGISAAALIADAGRLFARMQPAHRKQLLAGLDGSARELGLLLWNGPVRDAAGAVHWLNIQSTPHAENGEVIWDGVVTDVTTLKAAEAEVAAARDELRELYVHVQSVREEEKASIAHEIHDELGATLAGLKYQASSLTSRLQNTDAELHQHATDMSSTLGETVDAMRRLVTGLRPPLLDELGLVAALEWQAREFASRTGIACDLTADPDIRVTPEQGIGLFRIFQESLTNIAKHAGATRVETILERYDGQLRMQIADNGSGLAVDPNAPRASLGLRGMRERARALGGEFVISPGETGGTFVNVRVPEASLAAVSVAASAKSGTPARQATPRAG